MTTLMRTVETVDWEDPRQVPREQRARAIGWDPISGLHQGQQPQRLHSKAVYMAAPDPLAEMSDFPLTPRASIHGTSLPKPHVSHQAALTTSGHGKWRWRIARFCEYNA